MEQRNAVPGWGRVVGWALLWSVPGAGLGVLGLFLVAGFRGGINAHAELLFQALPLAATLILPALCPLAAGSVHRSFRVGWLVLLLQPLWIPVGAIIFLLVFGIATPR